jgi:hypothetical protein
MQETSNVSEAASIRQVERKTQRLHVELRACERAVEQSKGARRRIDSRLARELYFQQLLKQTIDQAPATKKNGAGAEGSDHDKAVSKLNELRLRSEADAQRIALELRIGLQAREEEHTAKVRGQIRGVVRRLLQQGVEDFTDAELDAPGGSASGATQTADDNAGDSWVLGNLEESLTNKLSGPSAPGRKSLQASLRLARCIDIMRKLHVEDDTWDDKAQALRDSLSMALFETMCWSSSISGHSEMVIAETPAVCAAKNHARRSAAAIVV